MKITHSSQNFRFILIYHNEKSNNSPEKRSKSRDY